MSFTTYTCEDFVEILATKAPVPGGGGASALVGALGTALGNMVGSLTVGKKKYADVEADIIALKEKADALQKDFLRLVEEDAKVFEPLSKAYGMPKDTEEEKAETHNQLTDILSLVLFRIREQESQCHKRNRKNRNVGFESQPRHKPCGYRGTNVRTHDYAYSLCKRQQSCVYETYNHNRSGR